MIRQRRLKFWIIIEWSRKFIKINKVTLDQSFKNKLEHSYNELYQGFELFEKTRGQQDIHDSFVILEEEKDSDICI